MAGMGKRMRPHTLTVPKPLVPIAGKPIVQRLVEDIAKVCNEPIEEVAFIIGRFGEAVEKSLIKIAESVGAKGTITYQDQPLGTAHAILCAKESLEGNLVVAFADTLFKADFTLDTSADGTIWVQQVEDPRPFGVVKLDANNNITDFVEKPETFVSDLAIIGIYYFKDGAYLREELQYLLDNDIKDSTVNTNQRYLEYLHADNTDLVAASAKITNSIIIPPVFIGENVVLNNSVVGPHVSIGNNTQVSDSVVSNSIVQESTIIKFANITNSMLGSFVSYQSTPADLSLGDYNTLKE